MPIESGEAPLTCEPARGITQEEICRFEEDGAVLFNGIFDPEWVALLGARDLWQYDDDAPPPELGALPDIDANLASCDILSFGYEPGDRSVDHVRTVHGSLGNSSSAQRRQALSIRYCGDGVVSASRPYAPAQSRLNAIKVDGEAIESRTHPNVWPH